MDGVSRRAVFVASHRPQLELSGVPERLWDALSKKLADQTFDASEAFSLLNIDYDEGEKRPWDPARCVRATRSINFKDPSQIYLIDHAWTFLIPTAKRQLREIPGLLDRIVNLTGCEARATDDVVDVAYDSLWRYAQFYSFRSDDGNPEDASPVWYVTDELGSGVRHSDEPNFRCVPFLHLPERIAYSLLFPIKNVREGDFVTVNFIENQFEDENHRRAMLLPWREFDTTDVNIAQVEPDVEYFLSGHLEETWSENAGESHRFDRSARIKVYSEYERIGERLTRPEFEIVTEQNVADVLWYTRHFKSFRELREEFPRKYVNQFPFEYVLTIKDLLGVVARRKSNSQIGSLDDNPPWLPKTFNLKTELVKFVEFYRRREKSGANNHWICKPFNLARGLDTYISNDINFIVRLPSTGPKIVQKYIENPVLFFRADCESRVKFDIRYVILLKSVNPLNVFLYKNFFLRFANKQFEMNDFDVYEQHFTVMNYNENTPLYRMLCAQFVEEWQKQYVNFPWSKVEESVKRMLRELFECAVEKPPPCGIAPNNQSRALYAADIMLSWDKDEGDNPVIQPKLLEINWMPDCNRACQYYPDFYNDIFGLFFLDEIPDTCMAL